MVPPYSEESTADNRAGGRNRGISSRLPGIDLLRGLAASAVVVAHVTKWPWGYASSGGLPTKICAFLREGMGTWGVGVFFVLSGLCIHLPTARREAAGAPRVLDVRAYLRRRARRIYPPHAVAIALSWVVAAWITLPKQLAPYLTVPTPGQLVAHIFMVHTFVPGAFYSISVVLWTIALEAHFYLLYPLLLRARRRASMGVLCGFLFGVMVVLRLADHLLPLAWRGLLTYNFPGRWWEWVLGAALAEWLTASERLPVSRRWALSIAALSALAICYLARVPHGILLIGVFGPFMYAAVASLVARVATRHGSIADRSLLAIGYRSYSLYLTHPIALTLMAPLFWHRVTSPLVVAVGAFGACFLLMAIYFSLVESRFLNSAKPIVAAGLEVERSSLVS